MRYCSLSYINSRYWHLHLFRLTTMLLGTAIPTVRHKNFARDFLMGTGTYQSLFLLHLLPIRNPGGAQELTKKREELNLWETLDSEFLCSCQKHLEILLHSRQPLNHRFKSQKWKNPRRKQETSLQLTHTVLITYYEVGRRQDVIQGADDKLGQTPQTHLNQ